MSKKDVQKALVERVPERELRTGGKSLTSARVHVKEDSDEEADELFGKMPPTRVLSRGALETSKKQKPTFNLGRSTPQQTVPIFNLGRSSPMEVEETEVEETEVSETEVEETEDNMRERKSRRDGDWDPDAVSDYEEEDQMEELNLAPNLDVDYEDSTHQYFIKKRKSRTSISKLWKFYSGLGGYFDHPSYVKRLQDDLPYYVLEYFRTYVWQENHMADLRKLRDLPDDSEEFAKLAFKMTQERFVNFGKAIGKRHPGKTPSKLPSNVLKNLGARNVEDLENWLLDAWEHRDDSGVKNLRLKRWFGWDTYRKQDRFHHENMFNYTHPPFLLNLLGVIVVFINDRDGGHGRKSSLELYIDEWRTGCPPVYYMCKEFFLHTIPLDPLAVMEALKGQAAKDGRIFHRHLEVRMREAYTYVMDLDKDDDETVDEVLEDLAVADELNVRWFLNEYVVHQLGGVQNFDPRSEKPMASLLYSMPGAPDLIFNQLDEKIILDYKRSALLYQEIKNRPMSSIPGCPHGQITYPHLYEPDGVIKPGTTLFSYAFQTGGYRKLCHIRGSKTSTISRLICCAPYYFTGYIIIEIDMKKLRTQLERDIPEDLKTKENWTLADHARNNKTKYNVVQHVDLAFQAWKAHVESEDRKEEEELFRKEAMESDGGDSDEL